MFSKDSPRFLWPCTDLFEAEDATLEIDCFLESASEFNPKAHVLALSVVLINF